MCAKRDMRFISSVQIKAEQADFLCLPGLKVSKSYWRQGIVLVVCSSLGFAHSSAIFFRRFLVIGIALHISNQALFFTELFEASYHLLD